MGLVTPEELDFEDYDAVIGINGTALGPWKLDYWYCGDQGAWRRWAPRYPQNKPRPMLVVQSNMSRLPEILDWDMLTFRLEHERQLAAAWRTENTCWLSATAVGHMCRNAGVKSLEIWGCDLAGDGHYGDDYRIGDTLSPKDGTIRRLGPGKERKHKAEKRHEKEKRTWAVLRKRMSITYRSPSGNAGGA